MPQVNCPACSRALNVPDSMIGQQVRCPLCNHIFQAAGQPAPPPPTPNYSPAPSRGPAAEDDYDRRGRWSSRSPSRSQPYDDYEDRGPGAMVPLTRDRGTGAAVWLIVAGALDLLVLLAFFAFLFTVDGRPPPAYAFMIIVVLALVFYVAPIV